MERPLMAYLKWLVLGVWLSGVEIALPPPAAGADLLPEKGDTGAADSPRYATASAHDPQFADKTRWPKLTGKEYFLEEQWPRADFTCGPTRAKPATCTAAGAAARCEATAPTWRRLT
jgi:hypothetical protein